MRKTASNKPRTAPAAAKKSSDQSTKKSFTKKGSFWDTDRNDDGTAGNFISKKKGVVEEIPESYKKMSAEYRRITNFNPNGAPRKNESEEESKLSRQEAKAVDKKDDSANGSEETATPKRRYEPRKFTRRPVKVSEEEAEKKPRNPGIKKTNEHTRRRSSDLPRVAKKSDKPSAGKATASKKPKPGRK